MGRFVCLDRVLILSVENNSAAWKSHHEHHGKDLGIGEAAVSVLASQPTKQPALGAEDEDLSDFDEPLSELRHRSLPDLAGSRIGKSLSESVIVSPPMTTWIDHLSSFKRSPNPAESTKSMTKLEPMQP